MNREKPDEHTCVAEAQGAEGDDKSSEGSSRRAWDEDGSDSPDRLVGELEAKLREMLLERERRGRGSRNCMGESTYPLIGHRKSFLRA